MPAVTRNRRCDPLGVRMLDHLERQLEAWSRKPGLRFVYTDWYREIEQWMTAGRSFELGCGIGRFKEYLGDVTTVDVLRTRWTDVVGDGEFLPIRSESVANLVLFDVLHHLPHPVSFFREAFRILKYGGRLIVADPYISPVSRFVYNTFHPEPTNSHCDPFEESIPLSSNEPFDSNQAVATVLFYKKFQSWKKHFPGFSILMRKRYAFVAYPATGGFGGRTLLPHKLVKWIQRKEKFLMPLSGLLAFRLLIVMEKNAIGQASSPEQEWVTA